MSSVITFTWIAYPKSYVYKSFPELTVKGNKRIDDLLLPFGGKSDTAIIHEYKVSHNSHERKKIIESALWQIFLNKYLLGPINSQTELEYSHVKNIIVRGVVFFNCDISEKWAVDIEEYTLTLDQAKYIVKHFSKNAAKYKDPQKGAFKKIIQRLKKESDESSINPEFLDLFPLKRANTSNKDS
jgi:hypothetical protein